MGKATRNIFIEKFGVAEEEPPVNGQPKKQPTPTPSDGGNIFIEKFGLKKKETTSQEPPTTSEEGGTSSQNGTENTVQSQLPLSKLPSEVKETDKKRYAVVESSTASDIIDGHKVRTRELADAFVTTPTNTKNSRNFNDYMQSREGKVGKIVSDIVAKGEFNKEDIDYLVKVAPTAAKQVIKSILPDVDEKQPISREIVNLFVTEGKKIVDNYTTQQKVGNSQRMVSDAGKSLVSLGVNPNQLQDDKYAQQVIATGASKKQQELQALEKQFPLEKVQKVSGRTGYTDEVRKDSQKYQQQKAAIEARYADIENKIGLSKAALFAVKNPTYAPVEIGEQWLKYASPDTYTLFLKGGKKDEVVKKRMAEVGIRALYASGKPGTAEMAKKDEDSLDFQYPQELMTETYHRLGAELHKGQNWFLNAAPSVKELDEAAKQLPEKNREIYNRFIREKERRNIGTDVPMSGLINKVGEGVASTATETWKGLGDIVGVRSDKKVATEALAEGSDTDFQDVGAYAPAVGRLKELNSKQKKGEKLSDQEINEKQDLETFAGVRSTAQEIIDGTGNLTGQVVFQALGTKGLGAAASAGIKGAGLLKVAPVVSGLATEEAIASTALNFGITKEAITNISAAAVAYASSYDSAKRDAYRLMPDDKDAGKRTIYATIVGGLNAGTERIFKDEKVLSAFNKEISPSIKTLVNKLSAGEISQEALAPAITKLLKNSASFGKEMGKANLKESTEELATSVGQSVATAILAPAKFNEQKAFDDAVSTFTTTFLHGGLVSGAAAINGFRANHISIPTLSKLGVDEKLTNDTKSFINGQVLSGNMTQEEANGKFRILNTASKINREVMPQVAEIAPYLPQKAKEKYSVQLLNEKILTAQADETKDPVLKSALETKVKESEKIRYNFIDQQIFVDDDYSVKTADQIIQEWEAYKQAEPGEDVGQTQEQITEDIFKRASEKGGEGITRSLDETKKDESIQFLKDQSLDTPNALYNQLSNDEGLTTDIIASNSQEEIQKSIDKYETELKKDNTDERIEEIDKHLTLLDKGLQKNISQPKIQSNGNEKTSQESGQKISKEGSQEAGSTEAVQPDVIQEGAAETAGTKAAPITKEAQELLDSIGEGSKPTFITKNLEKIANDNGIEIAGTTTADDVIQALRQKSVTNEISTSSKQSIKITNEDFNNLKDEGGFIDLKEVAPRLAIDLSDGDTVEFFAEKKRSGIWDKKRGLIVDEEGKPWGLTAILNDKEGYVQNISTKKPKVRVSAEQLEQSQPKPESKPKKETKKPPTRKDLSDQLKGLLSGKPLAYEGDTNPQTRVTFEDIGITPTDTIEQAIDKLIVYDGEFTDILTAIKADQNISNVKLEIVNRLEGGESGLYYPNGNEDGKDGTLQIANKGNVYYTAAHELLHFFTLDSKAAEDVKESDAYKSLEDIFNFLSSNKEKPVAIAGNVTMQNYGLTNVKEFMAEMFINPTFRQHVSDVYAKNKAEIFKQSKVLRDARNTGSIFDIIADLFRELFSKIFSGNTDIPFDEQKSVIDNAVKIATDLFFGGQDVTKGQVAGSEGGTVIQMGNQKAAALSLPSGLDPNVIQFVQSSFEQGATEEDIKGSLIDNGFTEEEAQSYIDNYNTPTERPSGIRKALVSNQLVSAVNLNKIGDKDMMSLGRRIIDTGEVKPEVLVQTILKERVGVLSPAEVVAMITYKADLDNSLRESYREFNLQQEAGNNTGRSGVEIADLERKIHDFDVAAVITANQQSMAFRLRQYMLDRDYNVTTQIEKYKKNNNGYIPPEVEAKFRDLDRELKAVKYKLDKAEKKLAEKADQDAVDNIKEDVSRENAKLSITEEEIQQKVAEGVQKEIDAIHDSLSKEKKSLANRAIKALENVQKKLRGKSYSDVTGIVAFIDSGITVIKNAIKAGVAVSDAVEMGIGRIKELLSKKGVTTWAKEDEFRKDALEGFEAEGVSTSKKSKDKSTINDDGTVSIPNDMLRDLVARGISDIEGLTDAVHSQVVKDVPEITKRQVRDYITEYGKTVNPSADDIQKQVNTAKRVGRLLSELEDLQNRKRREKSTSARYKLSNEEKDLKRQIRALDKTLPLTDEEKAEKSKSDLSTAKERVRSRIQELEFKIKNKDFAKKKRVEPAKDEELLKLELEKERVQNEFDTEQYKAELKKRTFKKKAEDFLLEITSGLVRGLVASVDLSAGFVQGLWRLFSNPVNSMNAFGTMLHHLVSEKGAQEYMNKMKSSPAYNLMQASKLAIDDKTGKQSAKEGLFISNWINLIWDHVVARVLAIPSAVFTKGDLSKGYTISKKINPYEASKRAFDGYVNSIRVDSFTQLADRLQDQGYTYESNPEVFEKAADFVNTTTGRASLGGIENSSRWLNIFMFAPRKVVSEVKLFTPYAFVYYAAMPPAVRKRALLNLSKFMGGFLVTNSLLWAALKDDDDDEDNFWNPTSSDFLTHKIGNKRFSIAGGAKSMIVFQSRMLKGEFTDQYGKTEKLGERFGKPINSRLDLGFRFVLGKASPAISVVAKKLDEKKGMEVDDSEIIKSLAVPMWMQDLKDLYKDSPAEVSTILMGLSFFGANVRTVEAKANALTKEELASPEFKFFTDRGAEIPEGKPEKIEIKDQEEAKIKKLADYGEEKVEEFKSTRKEFLKEALSDLKDIGYVYIDKFGSPSTTNDDGDKEEKSLDELSESEWKKIMSIMGARATQKTKKELFDQ